MEVQKNSMYIQKTQKQEKLLKFHSVQNQVGENWRLNLKTQKEEKHLPTDTIVQPKKTKHHQDIGVAVYLATQKR